LRLRDFRIIEFSSETRGQAESVAIGIQDYADETPLTIFNIDTIRHDFVMPSTELIGDGFLEVFEGDGEGWSFIKPGLKNTVIETAEKRRISNLCSNGLYYFSKILFFRQAYQKYLAQGHFVNGELYIAPLYNILIEEGRDIRFNLLKNSQIEHCGIPKDYEKLRES
jgi:dTDP-glucose pyrophosphorylase